MDMRAYTPEVMQLGNVRVYYWKNEEDRDFSIEVFRVNDDGMEISELTPGDLLNAAMLMRRVEAAIFPGPFVK
jgi:hypothetical protein